MAHRKFPAMIRSCRFHRRSPVNGSPMRSRTETIGATTPCDAGSRTVSGVAFMPRWLRIDKRTSSRSKCSPSIFEIFTASETMRSISASVFPDSGRCPTSPTSRAALWAHASALLVDDLPVPSEIRPFVSLPDVRHDGSSPGFLIRNGA